MVLKAPPLWLMLQLTTRSDLQNCSFEIVIKQLGAIKKQRLPNESQKTIWERERKRGGGGGGEQAVQIKHLSQKQKPHLAAETPGNSQLVVNLQRPQTV